ncbi:MAG: hypothetical protein RIB84_25710 [Sneathiellaceae bacterium]
MNWTFKALCCLLATLLAGPVLAERDGAGKSGYAAIEEGRAVYVETCQRCHGKLTEDLSSRVPRIVPVVMLPQGPTLSGIVGRPVASIENFKYSKALKKHRDNGAVWDRATLDLYLTNTQKFARGSYMLLRVSEPDRKLVLDYLEQAATHRQ